MTRPPPKARPRSAPRRRSTERQVSRLVLGSLLFLVVIDSIVVLWPAGSAGSAGSVGSPAPLSSPRTSSPPGGTSPGPASPATVPTVAGLPPCTRGDEPAADTEYDEWEVTLLDTSLRLPEGYAPPDLVSTSGAGLSGGYLVRSIVITDLSALRQAAAAAGVPIDVEAAYRSYQAQEELLTQKTAEEGEDEALKRTARPGHSEHQLGTAIDLKTEGQEDVPLDWDTTPTGRWALDNSWKYGFVLSYPRQREDVTCYGFEPWHFRYFGRDIAALVHRSGLTVREYLWQQRYATPQPSAPSPAAPGAVASTTA